MAYVALHFQQLWPSPQSVQSPGEDKHVEDGGERKIQQERLKMGVAERQEQKSKGKMTGTGWSQKFREDSAPRRERESGWELCLSLTDDCTSCVTDRTEVLTNNFPTLNPDIAASTPALPPEPVGEVS